MSVRPSTKLVACPECGTQFHRSIVWFGGREIMADRGCLCDPCEQKRAAAVTAVAAEQVHLDLWRKRVPDDYHRAAQSGVRPSLMPVLVWAPDDDCRRLGVFGAAGSGKSMSVALLVKLLGIRFEWTNGFAARSLYNRAVSGADDVERRANAAQWLRVRNAQLLVIDDVDKGTPTEPWANALFDLLEYRNGQRLVTIWTSNNAPGKIAGKFAKCGDPDLADAIERRLCAGAEIIAAS